MVSCEIHQRTLHPMCSLIVQVVVQIIILHFGLRIEAAKTIGTVRLEKKSKESNDKRNSG